MRAWLRAYAPNTLRAWAALRYDECREVNKSRRVWGKRPAGQDHLPTQAGAGSSSCHRLAPMRRRWLGDRLLV